MGFGEDRTPGDVTSVTRKRRVILIRKDLTRGLALFSTFFGQDAMVLTQRWIFFYMLHASAR
ncbi:MAG: hypothetical protein RBR35_17855, partial [Salinivirgaceae bacterium]|nr:hypothetical protein [Salinivirgaceae bacterium]